MRLDVLKGEFIGKRVKILDDGIEGKIIDETKNTIVIKKKDNSRKRVIKKDKIFKIKFKDEFIDIPGNLVNIRPEDRIKIKKWQ